MAIRAAIQAQLPTAALHTGRSPDFRLSRLSSLCALALIAHGIPLSLVHGLLTSCLTPKEASAVPDQTHASISCKRICFSKAEHSSLS